MLARCDTLASCSEEPGRITRRYGTPALAAARDLVAGWMREAGLDVRVDAIGNLRGRYAGTEPAAPALLLGSHLDSVRDAGRYDGPLGVLAAIAAVERLHKAGRRVRFPVEVVTFADEEGLRFQTTYLGSRTLTGLIDVSTLDRPDQDGITLRDAIAAFGGDAENLSAAALRQGEAFAYVEVHIEQGPRLEFEDVPVGVVTAIAGMARLTVEFRGEAGHAGTVAMDLRRDALPAAAEFILAVEDAGRSTPGLVATVGEVTVAPGASNVIPGSVRLSLDVRHPDDAIRTRSGAMLERRGRDIAAARSLDIAWKPVQENRAVPCDEGLAAKLEEAIVAAGHPVVRLPSGAGHDGAVMSEAAPVAMLFVRCAGGISHNPAEAVTLGDVAVAIDVLDRFIDRLAEQRS